MAAWALTRASHFGRFRSILRGHTQVRIWNRAEAAVNLMDGFLEALELKAPPRQGRVSDRGVTMLEFDEIDEVQSHWAHDDETRAGFIASPFAIREHETLDGPIGQYFAVLVQWLKFEAEHGLRTMSHQGPMVGCAADARRKIGAGKK